jgi:hypothetical protein
MAGGAVYHAHDDRVDRYRLRAPATSAERKVGV